MEYKVSVIVPVFKGEAYLQACVDGLLRQTLPEVEVVLVDDHSPDGGLALARRLYENNERVQVLTQPRNMGPGEARNTGIQAARGEYIAFMDCDDAILPSAYGQMYAAAREHGADVVHVTGMILPLDRSDPADLYTVREQDYLRIHSDSFALAKEITVLGDDLQDRYEKWKKHAYNWSPATKLIRRQFVLDRGLRFGDLKLSEDMAFHFGCLFMAKTYVLLPGEFYLYRISNNSLSRTKHTPEFLKMALQACLKVCPIADRIMEQIPFFQDHPEVRRGVKEYMIDVLEKEFIIPAFQEIGEETVRESDLLRDFFAGELGKDADFFYYSFVEQHRQYPPTRSSTALLNVDYLIENRARIEEMIARS